MKGTAMYELSGRAENVDWSDVAMAGRAYADNIVGEPALTAAMHCMADEIDRLRSLTRFQDGVIRSGDTACLTQAERDALLDAAEVCDSRERRSIEFRLPQEAEHWRCLAATIRGLSERLSSGTQETSIREECHK